MHPAPNVRPAHAAPHRSTCCPRRTARLLAIGLIAAASFAVSMAHASSRQAAALGQPGELKNVDRTIDITMSDALRFSPASIAVRRNETIRFVLKNEGQLRHEMVLGRIAELKKHAALMRRFPDMQHAEPNQASVAPGDTGVLVWQFTQPGQVDFACLQPGHFEGGMRGGVAVSTVAMALPAQAVAAAAVALPAAAVDSQAGATPADAAPAQAPLPVSQPQSQPQPQPTTPVTVSDDVSDGEIRKVDKDGKKITIRHGDLKNLNMPGMTMVFQIKDLSLLEQLKPGDKVKFRAAKTAGGFVATDVQRVDDGAAPR
jgi:uncharacterized cupredoxin-like copper-binding protein/Cu/Ag efflux protein CusF